jgi:hypothetical protein
MGGIGSGRKLKYPKTEHGVEFNREFSKKQYQRYRQMVFDHYGHECVCCGERRAAFLAIDHIDGSSGQRIKEPGQRNLTHWLIKNDFPEGFRVLCHNCNMAVRWGKVCPHEEERQAAASGC